MAKNDLKPAAIIAGAAVIGGIFFFSTRKKRRCTELPDIWSPDGPMHMTVNAQDQAFELARYKIREIILKPADPDNPIRLDDIAIYVADGLRDCAWEKMETDKQKQVWEGIKSIVNEVNQRAEQDPDAFLQSFD